jgi:hypothetical protein
LRLQIVAYKRSWRDIFSTERGIFTKKEKEAKRKKRAEGEGLLKLPQLMEIESGGLRQLLLDDFHKLLG